MAWEKTGETLPGIEASADLSAHQFKFVTIDSNGQAAVAGAGVSIAGALQNKPDAQGKACTIWGPGTVTKAIAGAAVAQGADVTPDATGRAVTSASGNYIVGKALKAAANANEIISVFITQPGRTA
jgi:hypothetical protein